MWHTLFPINSTLINNTNSSVIQPIIQNKLQPLPIDNNNNNDDNDDINNDNSEYVTLLICDGCDEEHSVESLLQLLPQGSKKKLKIPMKKRAQPCYTPLFFKKIGT